MTTRKTHHLLTSILILLKTRNFYVITNDFEATHDWDEKKNMLKAKSEKTAVGEKIA